MKPAEYGSQSVVNTILQKKVKNTKRLLTKRTKRKQNILQRGRKKRGETDLQRTR